MNAENNLEGNTMSTKITETNIFQSEKKIEAKKNLPSYLSQVFLWMAFALVLTGVTAVIVDSHLDWEIYILGNSTRLTALFIFQLAMVFAFRWITKYFSVITVILYYALYAIVSGLTASIIFHIFTTENIIGVFCATSFAFFGLSIYGFMTKRDLGPIGNFCMMGLFGLIAILLMSIFIPQLQESAVQHVISAIGVIVFAGFTAYDVQHIKQNYSDKMLASDKTKNAIIGGLGLYINFVNLFFDLLDLISGGKK